MLVINGTDLTTLGVVCQRRKLPEIGERTDLLQVPGGQAVRTGGAIPEGVIEVDLTWSATTHALALAARDALKAALRGKVRIGFTDTPDREWVGYLQRPSRLDLEVPAWSALDGAGQLHFVVPEGYAIATAASAAAGLNPSLALGDAPSPLRVAITAAATPVTAVTIQVRAGATVLSTAAWTGTLAAGKVLVIDAATSTAVNDGVNAYGAMSTASIYPVADPALGADNVLITIVGAGATAATTWYKRWG